MKNFCKGVILGILILVLFRGIGFGQEILEKPEKENMNNKPIVSEETEEREWLTFLPQTGTGEEPQVTAQTLLEKGSSTGKVTFDFTIPGAFRIESPEGVILQIPTASLSLDEGRPVVPGLVANFVLPGSVDLTGIKIVEDKILRLKQENPLIHEIIAITPEGLDRRPLKVEPLSQGIYPPKSFRLNGREPLRDGNTIGSVTVWPVQYDVDEKEWIIHTEVKLEVTFSRKSISKQDKKRYREEALELFGDMGPLPRGERTTWAEEETKVSRQNGFLVKRDGSTEFTIIAASYLRPDGTFNSTRHYRVISYGEEQNEESENGEGLLNKVTSPYESREVGLERLQEKCEEIEDVSNYEQGINIIRKLWVSSPGIILFSPSSGVGVTLCPLATLLDWPLLGVGDVGDIQGITELINDLKVEKIIVGGKITQPMEFLISSTSLSVITLANEDEINLFIAAQRELQGFKIPMQTPLEIAYREAKNHDMVQELMSEETVKSIVKASEYWILYCNEFSNSAASLASYFVSNTRNVLNWSANSIRNFLITSTDATWVSLMGDGDVGEVSCFFIDDPVDDGGAEVYEPGSGNGIIATDFYYEDLDASVGSLPSSWAPDCWVSRPIGYNDTSTMDYVNTYVAYRERSLPDPEWTDGWAVCGAYYDWWNDSRCALSDVDTYLQSRGVNTSVELHVGSGWGEFTEDNFVDGTYGLDSGNCVGYVNTHGNYDSISFDTSKLYESEVISHASIWSQKPFFQYTDACLTALFAGSQRVEASNWYPENYGNIACRFIDSGALGFLGATMMSYLGYIDNVDRQVFEHRLTDWDYIVAAAIAWGRESYYAAQSSPGAYARKTVWELMLLGDAGYNLYMEKTDPYVYVPNSMHNIELSPPSPASLYFNDDVNITFDYSTNEFGGVRIFVRPFTDGSLTPNYAAHGSPLYPYGSGSGSGLFTITSGEVIVDQVRFQMWNGDQTELLVESFIDVEYHFKGTIEPCECDLNHDGRCDMQDWLLFGEDWGRTDCGTPPGSGNPPNDCECDLNADGRCDMQDWLLFGEDWGRTDCPVP